MLTKLSSLPDNIEEGAAYGASLWRFQRRTRVTSSRFADILTEPRTIPKEFIQRHINLIPVEERTKVLKSGLRKGQVVPADGLAAKVKEAAECAGHFCFGESAMSYMYEIIAKTITGHDRVGGKSAAIDRGMEKEPEAIEFYGKNHLFTDDGVEPGRFLMLQDSIIGGTPDGFIEDGIDNDGPGVLEVKCPESTTHLRTFLSRQVPEDYLPQVHGHIWLSGRSWCDFVSYDDRFPLSMRMVVIRVHSIDHSHIEFLHEARPRIIGFAEMVSEKASELQRLYNLALPSEKEVIDNALKDQFEAQYSQPEA